MSPPKRLRLRRADRCQICRRDLGVGEEALWDRSARVVICLQCDSAAGAVDRGQPGSSAMREYERRHDAREQHARDKLGGLDVLLAKVIDEPESTTAWRQGAYGEIRTGQRLAKHLDGTGVRVLHDRCVPRHGQANIDHIAIGPGGVTVIDSKTHHGKLRVDWRGGLFAPRRDVLLIDGRDRTGLIDGLERQIGYVRSALGPIDPDEQIDVRGALCFPNVDGLPMFRHLAIRDILIDGPKPIAALARRQGTLSAGDIERIVNQLGRSLPAAS
jgi:hypothetical protein